jgi:hypothetical protein
VSLDVLPRHQRLSGAGAAPPFGSSAVACASVVEGAPDVMATQTALAADGAARLLAAFGDKLFAVEVSDPTAAMPSGSVDLAEPIAALRVELVGRRAYGVGSKSSLQPAFELEPALAASAGHDVGSWVRRRESADLLLRIAAHQVELARVAR